MSKLAFKEITKRFPGVLALDRVSFTAESGQVIALVGENGAGKSTLLKVLNGDYQADGGQYLIDDQEVHFHSPREAIAAGIGIIYQERQIIPYLTVAENIFMEDIPVGAGHLVDFRKLNAAAQEIIDEFRLPIRAGDRVKNLSVAYQQMVEIMKVCRRHPKIIAFDEPTASLSDAEIETLFEIIQQLKQKGLIILYVSHRMKEIFQITDQVVILKDGRFVQQLATADTNEIDIVKKMVGRDLGDIFAGLSRNTAYGDTILEVKDLVAPNVDHVSFSLRKGEVLGFAGLVGAGRTETMRLIFGADPLESGEIFIDGKKVSFRSPSQAIRSGVALCPEDRKDQGIIAIRPIRENVSIAALQLMKQYFIDRKAETQMAEHGREELNIRTPDVEKKIGELSGGNQQKVILARWLAAHPKVLILDEPTKGIDVGAKFEIYQIICDLAKQGIGVIVVSSELPEVMGVCDRIVVMCQGHITGELMREEATDQKILMLAMKDILGESNHA